MPESRSRSRKRKAAAVTKACGRDEERDVQSQSCAVQSSREERYVPRFGSSNKKPRTMFSCSQPASRVTIPNSELSSTSQCNEDITHTSDSKTSECVTSASEPEAGSINNAAPTIICGLGPCSITDTTQDDSNITTAEVVNSFSSQVQESHSVDECIPGMFLSQHCPQSQETPSLPPSITNTHVACNEQHHTSFTNDESTESSPTGAQNTSPSPQTVDKHVQSLSQHTSIQTDALPGVVIDIAPTMTSTSSSEPFGGNIEPQESNKMNLDLLDPLECEEELDNETMRGSESCLNQQTPAVNETDDSSTPNNDTSNPSPTCPIAVLGVDTTSVTTSNDSLLQNVQMMSTSPSDTTAVIIDHCGSSLYDDCNNERGIKDKEVSSKINDGVQCDDDCESGGISEGVEDVMVVGGDSGQLSIAHESQLNKDKQSMVSPPVSADELLAVKEMMDLTAHDLLESQLLEEATVPSCSPNIHPQTIDAGVCGMPALNSGVILSSDSVVTVTNNTAGGSQILRGLIKELSTLNQFVMACKRELDASRRQRTVWIRSQQGNRGR